MVDYYIIAYAITEIVRSKALLPVASITLISSSVYVYQEYGLEILINNVAAISSICFCLYGVSGSIWNDIMKPPLYTIQLKKRLFVGYEQFLAESYTVFIHYVGILAGMIIMIEAAGGPRLPFNQTLLKRAKKRRKLLYLLGFTIFLCSCYSHITLIHFKFKRYSGGDEEDYD